MVVEVSLTLLKDLCISADEYLYLYLSYKEKYDILDSLGLKVDLEKLQTQHYLKIGEERPIVREEFIQNIEKPDDQMWNELLSCYPIKVSVKGQPRILRARDPYGSTNAAARERYLKYIKGNVQKHNEVIAALNRELDFRRKGDQIGYMQMLTTWVNQKTWEKYPPEIDELGFDERRPERITRQL